MLTKVRHGLSRSGGLLLPLWYDMYINDNFTTSYHIVLLVRINLFLARQCS